MQGLEAESRSLRMSILAVGVVLLDYASQVLLLLLVLLHPASQAAINPCEALMSDIMAAQTEMSEETGFSFYSGMLSLGACTGKLPPSSPLIPLYPRLPPHRSGLGKVWCRLWWWVCRTKCNLCGWCTWNLAADYHICDTCSIGVACHKCQAWHILVMSLTRVNISDSWLLYFWL